MEAPEDAEASKEPEAKEKKSGEAAESGLSVIGMALVAVGGSIGVLGFVAFFGAAILWVRMDKAGMPANEAVAVVPKPVLLTTGASFLVPALLIALGFTAILYLFESIREAYANSRIERRLKSGAVRVSPACLEKFWGWLGDFFFAGPKRSAKLEVELGRAKARREAAAKAQEQAAAELKRARGLESIAKVIRDSGADPANVSVPKLEAAYVQAYENVTRLSLEWNPETPAADKEAAAEPEPSPGQKDLVREERTADEARVITRVRAERGQRGLRIASFALLFLVGTVAAIDSYSVAVPVGRIIVLFLVALALTAVCLSVLARTNFAWLALATFISVGIYVGLLTYYRTVGDAKVEPVALLRSDGAPLYGFFVAQTSDRVYLGTTLPHGRFRFDAISREEVTDMTVGPLRPTDEASEYGRRMAIGICQVARERSPVRATPVEAKVSEKKAGAPTKDKAPVKEACNGADLKRLWVEQKNDMDEGETDAEKGSA